MGVKETEIFKNALCIQYASAFELFVSGGLFACFRQESAGAVGWDIWGRIRGWPKLSLNVGCAHVGSVSQRCSARASCCA